MFDVMVILPLAATGAGAILIMLVAAFETFRREGISILGMGLFAFAFFIQLTVDNSGDIYPFAEVFNGMLVANTFTKVAGLIILACGFFSALAAQTYFTQNKGFVLEFYCMLLFAAFGMLLLTMVAELITLFIALEIMSLAVYTLVGYDRHSVIRAEAVLKYLMLGAFAGAFYVMGAVLVYAGTGSTSFAAIGAVVADSGYLSNPALVGGSFLILFAFLFKAAAFPFHAWVIDVYDGAPLPVTAFMATAVKTSIFAVLANFLLINPEVHQGWVTFLFYLSILTMFAGNLIAIGQQNLKRMLAASGIVHTGYLLIALVALGSERFSGGAILFYLAAYGVATLGLFVALSYLSGQDERRVSFDDFRGLAKVRPYSAACIAIFLLSMAGIPPTAGFMGKFYIIAGAFQAGHAVLAVLGIVSSILSLWYYLHLIIVMYFREPEQRFEVAELTLAPLGTIVLAVCVFAISFYPVVL
ncbi:MAG: NADH-quinone oxidoreductase subunit N [Desulfofustis sp.]|jgi:NADH-quinone oxidoreductase subunit N|nr:NADH-quinone oxidoreductase subunit N [Desulfofustis sp.]